MSGAHATPERTVVVTRLQQLYSEHRIGARNFDCKFKVSCTEAANGRALKHGSEPHVGSRYGESLRIVVVSMDVGGGDSVHTIESRTAEIESIEAPFNRHMSGTIAFLKVLLGKSDNTSVLPLYSMLNAAKCSGLEGMNAVPGTLYTNCSEYIKNEVAALEPQLVWLQGNTVSSIFWEELENIEIASLSEEIKPIIKEYIFRLKHQHGQCIVVITPHPSDRRGRWQQFEKAFMPLITSCVQRLLTETEK